GLGELRARHTNSRINEHFSVRASENGNIAPGALKHAHIPAQVMRRYRRGSGTVLDKGYNPARLRKSLARCEPATGGPKNRARHAAETKMAARKQVFLLQNHGSLLTVLRFPAVIAQEIAPALSLSSQLRLVAIGGIASALPPCRGRVYWFATCSGAPSHCLSYTQDKASWRVRLTHQKWRSHTSRVPLQHH